MPRQFRLYVRPSVRLPVRPSVTRVYCIKTAERIIEILSPTDRLIILVFRHQGSLHKSDGFTSKGAPNGGSNFRPICGYIKARGYVYEVRILFSERYFRTLTYSILAYVNMNRIHTQTMITETANWFLIANVLITLLSDFVVQTGQFN